MSLELKIKSKHLAAEAGIIRKESQKLKASNKSQKLFLKSNEVSPEKLAKWKAQASERSAMVANLNHHRKTKVRTAARSTHLAYGFLRGTPYSTIENEHTRNAPNWSAIEKMIARYSKEDSRVVLQRFSQWKNERSQVTD